MTDKERLKKGCMFTDEHFEHQLQYIREIRLSERKFYQKVTDLYATAFDDDKNAMTARKAVRQYGLEGMHVQNASDLAGVSPGALYRYFDGKNHLILETPIYVDKQAATIFDCVKFTPLTMLTNPMGAVKKLWLPYFHFWVAHPDETVFCHRFRDSAFFPEYNKARDFTYFHTFIGMVACSSRYFRRWTASTRNCCGPTFSSQR